MNVPVGGAFAQAGSIRTELNDNFYFAKDCGVVLTVILNAPKSDPYLLVNERAVSPSFSLKLEGSIPEVMEKVSQEIINSGLGKKFDPVIFVRGATGTKWAYKVAGGHPKTGVDVMTHIEDILRDPENKAGFIPKEQPKAGIHLVKG